MERESVIGIPNISLQGPLPQVLPESLQPIQGNLLNGAVVAAGEPGPPYPMMVPGCQFGSVRKEIPSEGNLRRSRWQTPVLDWLPFDREPAPACTIERLTSVPAAFGQNDELGARLNR